MITCLLAAVNPDPLQATLVRTQHIALKAGPSIERVRQALMQDTTTRV